MDNNSAIRIISKASQAVLNRHPMNRENGYFHWQKIQVQFHQVFLTEVDINSKKWAIDHSAGYDKGRWLNTGLWVRPFGTLPLIAED